MPTKVIQPPPGRIISQIMPEHAAAQLDAKLAAYLLAAAAKACDAFSYTIQGVGDIRVLSAKIYETPEGLLVQPVFVNITGGPDPHPALPEGVRVKEALFKELQHRDPRLLAIRTGTRVTRPDAFHAFTWESTRTAVDCPPPCPMPPSNPPNPPASLQEKEKPVQSNLQRLLLPTTNVLEHFYAYLKWDRWERLRGSKVCAWNDVMKPGVLHVSVRTGTDEELIRYVILPFDTPEKACAFAYKMLEETELAYNEWIKKKAIAQLKPVGIDSSRWYAAPNPKAEDIGKNDFAVSVAFKKPKHPCEHGPGIARLFPETPEPISAAAFKPRYCKHCGHSHGCMCPRDEEPREPVNRCRLREPKVVL